MSVQIQTILGPKIDECMCHNPDNCVPLTEVCVSVQTILVEIQEGNMDAACCLWVSFLNVLEARWEDGLHDGVLEHKLHLGGYFDNFVMSVVESRQFHLHG